MSTAVQPATERRWPMAAAVIVTVGLTAALPSSIRPEPRWFLSVLGLLLLIQVAGEPGRIGPPKRRVQILTRLLLLLLVVSATVTMLLLIHELVVGRDLKTSATRLLLAGNTVWVSNNIVFALLFWELDSGGSASRARRMPDTPISPSPST